MVFTYEGREVGAYTIRGTFEGEREATIRQLAFDLKCSPEEIKAEMAYR